MSNVKRLDVWTVVRTILEQNPGIKSGQLWRKVGEKTGYGRSALYERFDSFEEQGKIVRDKGKCFFPEQYDVYISTKKYPRKRFVSKADLEVALNHSQKLVLGLEAFFVDDQLWYPQVEPWASEVRTEGMSLKRFAEEHLENGYPAIYKKMRAYLEVREELKRLTQKKGYSKELVDDTRLFMATKIGLHKQYMSEETRNWILTRPRKIPFDLAKIMWDNIQTFYELAVEVNNLKEKIENGEPLSGSCEFCPNVRIDR